MHVYLQHPIHSGEILIVSLTFSPMFYCISVLRLRKTVVSELDVSLSFHLLMTLSLHDPLMTNTWVITTYSASLPPLMLQR